MIFQKMTAVQAGAEFRLTDYTVSVVKSFRWSNSKGHILVGFGVSYWHSFFKFAFESPKLHHHSLVFSSANMICGGLGVEGTPRDFQSQKEKFLISQRCIEGNMN